MASKHHSKYEPLVSYIAAQTDRAVTLSFAEIEAIIGSPLPAPMQRDTARWRRPEHAVVRRLELLGWWARLDRRKTCVHFTREE